MKFYYIILVLFMALLAGCKQESITDEGFAVVPSKFLVGTWDLVEINGVAGEYGYFVNETKSCIEGEVEFALEGGNMTGTFGGGLFSADGDQHFAMWNMIWQYTLDGIKYTTYCSVDWNATDWTEASFTLTARKNATAVDGSRSPIVGGEIWKFKKREK